MIILKGIHSVVIYLTNKNPIDRDLTTQLFLFYIKYKMEAFLTEIIYYIPSMEHMNRYCNIHTEALKNVLKKQASWPSHFTPKT